MKSIILALALAEVEPAAGAPVLGAGVAGGETKMVIAGRPEYNASGMHRFNFGRGYRDEWTTPFAAPILDLKRFAGGLTPVRPVGSFQGVGLSLQGADGLAYTFRTLDKDPTRLLPKEWRDSIPANIVQDQASAANPAGLIIVPPLAEVAGIPHTNPILVYMPDDPALGTFREAFGGRSGSIDLDPRPADGVRDGFHNATEIISTSELWKRHLEGTAEVDSRALLRARIFDLFIGDWDQHFDQWRWMKVPGNGGYLPLPEDRDQAFADYSGAMMSLNRNALPGFAEWRDDFENIERLLIQGRDVDDWLLNVMPRAAYEEVAKDLRTRLTDEAIEKAVRSMPPEWFALRGVELIHDLKRRRELLPEAAVDFYERRAEFVNAHGTNQADVARLTRDADGSVLLEISLAGEDGTPLPPYFSRRFFKTETKEIRVYLYGGNDRYTSAGPRSRVIVRVSGGAGDDRLDDSQGGHTRFYDVDSPAEVVKGSNTRSSSEARRRVPPKDAAPWLEQQDFGRLTMMSPLLWWAPDAGVVTTLGVLHYRYGYRRQPYSSVQSIYVEYKSERAAPALTYSGDFRWRSQAGRASFLQAFSDGARNYNFFGLGNDTPSESEKSFYEADQEVYGLFYAMAYENAKRTFRVGLGPEVKYSRNAAADDTLIGTQKPYGFGNFGQAGFRLVLDVDSRGRALTGLGVAGLATPKSLLTDTSFKFHLESRVYPALWNVDEGFGAVEGAVTGTWQLARSLTVAGRIGGKTVWGPYPWHEAAFLGDPANIRGYDRNRFAGDSSLFGNAQVMVSLFNLNFILPLRLGVLGLVDAGRVWFEGESSDTWHPAYGGGIFVRVLPARTVMHALLAQGDEEGGVKFYVNMGFGI